MYIDQINGIFCSLGSPQRAACHNASFLSHMFGADQIQSMTAAAARAQAGTIRRELLDCRDELGRAVAAAAEKPVGVVLRECFEGLLIPRIQVSSCVVGRIVLPYVC